MVDEVPVAFVVNSTLRDREQKHNTRCINVNTSNNLFFGSSNNTRNNSIVGRNITRFFFFFSHFVGHIRNNRSNTRNTGCNNSGRSRNST